MENKKEVKEVQDIKFVPKSLKSENGEEIFKGFFMIRPPSVRERMKCIKQLGFDYNAAGEAVSKSNSNMEALIGMIDATEEFITRVELKHKDGTVIKSFKELERDNRCVSIITEVAQAILQGFTLSKNSSPA